jgi:hypothetical protein
VLEALCSEYGVADTYVIVKLETVRININMEVTSVRSGVTLEYCVVEPPGPCQNSVVAFSLANFSGSARSAILYQSHVTQDPEDDPSTHSTFDAGLVSQTIQHR